MVRKVARDDTGELRTKQLTSEHLLIIKAKPAWELDNTDFRVSKNNYGNILDTLYVVRLGVKGNCRAMKKK